MEKFIEEVFRILVDGFKEEMNVVVIEEMGSTRKHFGLPFNVTRYTL
jgi:hypothetical protein